VLGVCCLGFFLPSLCNDDISSSDCTTSDRIMDNESECDTEWLWLNFEVQAPCVI
jgi:hypothetical protein